MGETSKDTSVEKLVESMQRMMAQLLEQAQTKTLSGTDILKNLEPNPVRLTGPCDYFSWSRNALLILESHGLEKFLKEDEKKPVEVTQEQWDQSQKRVMVWLLSSMDKAVREQVEGFHTAAEVWTSIEKQFSGKSNKMQVTRIIRELRHIKQEQKTVTEYAGEIKKLFRDLEYFRPFKAHDPKDVPLLREWFEPILVQAFLEGLNEEFNLRSQLILALPDWPTLDQTVASILEEETRLSNQIVVPSVNVDTKAALSSLTQVQPNVGMRYDQANTTRSNYKKKTTSICDNCKRPGHIRRNCFELIGYPPGWQKRPQNRPSSENNNERRFNHSHLTSATSGTQLAPRPSSENNTEMRFNCNHLTAATGETQVTAGIQALEEFKAKMMTATSENPEMASSSSGAQGVGIRKNTWDWD
uniref:Uncharacterized protein n=1 Tax=Avena sativa TaxID=4498 RepID=A0ACD5VES3_AVESA